MPGAALPERCRPLPRQAPPWPPFQTLSAPVLSLPLRRTRPPGSGSRRALAALSLWLGDRASRPRCGSPVPPPTVPERGSPPQRLGPSLAPAGRHPRPTRDCRALDANCPGLRGSAPRQVLLRPPPQTPPALAPSGPEQRTRFPSSSSRRGGMARPLWPAGRASRPRCGSPVPPPTVPERGSPPQRLGPSLAPAGRHPRPTPNCLAPSAHPPRPPGPAQMSALYLWLSRVLPAPFLAVPHRYKRLPGAGSF